MPFRHCICFQLDRFIRSGSGHLKQITRGITNYSTSTAVTETVNKFPTNTVLSATPNPAQFGGSVTLTATVSGSTPTGTVTFKDGTTTLGTGTIASGVATFSTSALSVNTHGVTALYAGDANNAPSTSAASTVTVTAKVTTTSVTVNPNPATVGQSVTLTATMAGINATGTVNFTDGTTIIGTVTASGTGSAATATLVTNFTTVGTHSIAATYGGDINNSASTSAAVTETVNLGTTTTVVASGNPVIVGQSITLSAILSGLTSTATGTVTFKDGATTIGTGTLSAGVASLSTSFTTAGAHSITAVYAGDTNWLGSTSSAVSETVNAAASTTALSLTPNLAAVGQLVAMTATVTGSTPTGSVTFMDGTTTLSASPSTANIGQSVTLTASTTGLSPTGTVTFMDGATTLGTGTLAGTGSTRTATLNVSFSTTGAHSLTATRAKSNMRSRRVYSNSTNRSTGVICDQTITLTGAKASKDYPSHLRRIRFKDPESGKTLVFLTNDFQLPALTICALYKSRWQVELFYK